MKTRSYHQIGLEKFVKTVESFVKKESLNNATIKAVFTKNGSDWGYLIGKCEIGVAHMDVEVIYSDHAFICKSFSDFDLKSFLESLERGGFIVSENVPPLICMDKTNISWVEEIVPSHATSSQYPVRKYSAKLNGCALFNETILLGYGMPFNPSSGDYIKNFMGMRQFNGHGDARNGQISIEISDQRGRICVVDGQVLVDGDDHDVCLVGRTDIQSSIILKAGDSVEIDERSLGDAELWLLTKENEILDFRSKKCEWQYRIETLDNENAKKEHYLAVIERGEGHECEFKPYIDLSNKNSKSEEIEKSVCALSNAQGGILFIGVSDEGCIEGVDNDVKKRYQSCLDEALDSYKKDVSKRLCEILRDNRCFDISIVKLGEKHVVVISVRRSKETNYYLNKRTAFVRKGATSFRMISAEERENSDIFFTSV